MSDHRQYAAYVLIQAVRNEVEQLTAPVSVAITLHLAKKR